MNIFLPGKKYNFLIIPFLFFFFFSERSYASPPGLGGPGGGHGSPGHSVNEEPTRSSPRRVGDRLYFTPACPIIAQNFNNTLNAAADANGSTSDTSSVGWYLDASQVPNAVYFSVKSHRIKAQTLGGVGVWYSRVFNISGYTGIQVDAKISSEGPLTSSEYMSVSYILNGGPETLIEKVTGDFGADSTPVVTSAPMTGQTVQIVVRIYNTTVGNADYYIENYDVFKEVGPCTVSGGITVSASASNSGVLTCTNPSTTLTASTTATGTTTYSWTGPNSFTATGASVTATAAGTYTVTGTNSAGTGTGTVTVTSNTTAPAGVTATASGSLTCSNSSVTLTGSSTTSGTTFSWSGPSGFTATGATATATAAGSYTLTATNPTTGCTTAVSTTVTQILTAPASVTATASGSLSCTTTSVTLTGSSTTSGTTFSWSGPSGFTATGATATATAAGTYTLTATNPTTGCTTAVSTTVTQNLTAPANVTASNDGPLTCNITSVTMNASSTTTSGVTYAWSGTGNAINYGATGASVTTTAPGTYILTATYTSTGCTATAMTSVYQVSTTPGTVTASNNGPLTCSASSVTLSGSSTLQNGVTYAWTGPSSFTATGTSATVTVPGTYTLTATYTPTGCTATATTTVAQNITAPAGVTATASGSLTCSTTSVTLTGSSTTSGTTFSWSGPSGFTATGATATATASGAYTVTATNPTSGCTATASVTVTQTITPPAGVAIASSNNATQLTCSTNFITLLGSSTTSGSTFSWSGPNNFSVASSAANVFNPGTYTLTVTNPSDGCTSTASIAITQNMTPPANVAISPDLVTLTCSNPSSTLTGSSSTSGVSYAWSGPNGFTASGTTTTVISAGSYILTVTDPTNGCTNTTAATISTNFTPPANVTAINDGPQTCSNVNVLLTGGSTTTGTTFAWTGPNSFTATGATATLTSFGQDGTYTLMATNPANGCTAIATTVVAEDIATPTDVSVSSSTSSPVLNCTNTSLTLTASSSTPGVTYAWRIGTTGSTVLGTSASLTVSQPNAYDVLVTNPANGCAFLSGQTVTQNITPPASVAVTTMPANAVLTCANTSVALTGNSSVSGASYNWSGPSGFTASSASASATTPGAYNLTVTDPSNGCTATASSVVTQNTTAPGGVATTAVPATAQITCDHPTVLLTGSSTTAGVTYSWSGPSVVSTTEATATVNGPGTYTVSVTDPTNGCVTTLPGSVTKNVSVPVGLTASPSDIISCFTPVIDLQGGSTTPGATFAWSGPGGYTANTAEAETEMPGSYTLIVTNPANGCTASTSTVVLADTATPANVTASNNGPLNCINTSATITSSSSTQGVDFTWVTPGNTFISGATAVVTVPGTYTIQVTNDENGCFSQATTTVIQNTTGCSGSTAITPGAISSRSMEGFSGDTATGFVYKAYPNPFSTTAFIEFTSPVSSPVKVEIYSTYGYREQLLFSSTVNANQVYKLQLTGLSSGTHFCVINNNSKVYTTKIVVIR